MSGKALSSPIECLVSRFSSGLWFRRNFALPLVPHNSRHSIVQVLSGGPLLIRSNTNLSSHQPFKCDKYVSFEASCRKLSFGKSRFSPLARASFQNLVWLRKPANIESFRTILLRSLSSDNIRISRAKEEKFGFETISLLGLFLSPILVLITYERQSSSQALMQALPAVSTDGERSDAELLSVATAASPPGLLRYARALLNWAAIQLRALRLFALWCSRAARHAVVFGPLALAALPAAAAGRPQAAKAVACNSRTATAGGRVPHRGLSVPLPQRCPSAFLHLRLCLLRALSTPVRLVTRPPRLRQSRSCRSLSSVRIGPTPAPDGGQAAKRAGVKVLLSRANGQALRIRR